MFLYLRTNFQVSSIILTSFTQRVILPKKQPLKIPPRLGLNIKLSVNEKPCNITLIIFHHVNHQKSLTHSYQISNCH